MKILTIPRKAAESSNLFKICQILGWKLTNSIQENYDMAIVWDLRLRRPKLPIADILPVPVLNKNANDVTKDTVAKKFEEVFGYGLSVDPTTFSGTAMRKTNDINGMHDGVVVQCPITREAVASVSTASQMSAGLAVESGKELIYPLPKAEYCYERLIDNTTLDGLQTIDYRTAVLNGKVIMLYKKLRAVNDRFKSGAIEGEELDPEKFYSSAELGKIAEFTSQLGVDFAELDVIRDKDSKMFIVDVNMTPYAMTAMKWTDYSAYAKKFKEYCESLIQ